MAYIEKTYNIKGPLGLIESEWADVMDWLANIPRGEEPDPAQAGVDGMPPADPEHQDPH